jgi:molybdopterin-guanine dinucleotide biosynthesis protein A
MSHPDRTLLAAYVPPELREDMWELARQHERSVSGEVRHALTQYVRNQNESEKRLATA